MNYGNSQEAQYIKQVYDKITNPEFMGRREYGSGLAAELRGEEVEFPFCGVKFNLSCMLIEGGLRLVSRVRKNGIDRNFEEDMFFDATTSSTGKLSDEFVTKILKENIIPRVRDLNSK